ncbi:YbaB/EbfC family nucleoid-associated protein [Streptomyces sp. NPDC086010]|uniref:YbaB/EbfC family nucleoid-associated protein n=1 Tax=Streptomyces sp. NPDC086010 TaxID=3365745 RepID=UPI0037D09821
MEDWKSFLPKNESDLLAQWDQLQKARTDLLALSVTRRSADASVEVTCDGQGELSGLRFLNDKYRTMSSKQLAASVLEAVTEARRHVHGQVQERMGDLVGLGALPGWEELGEFDWNDFLKPMREEGYDLDALADRAKKKGTGGHA